MNDRTPDPEGHPALNKRAEAAAWLARLHGPARTERVEEGFKRWIAADAEHARAFELLTERLEVVERLRTRSLPKRWHSGVQRDRPRFAIVAAAAVGTAALAAIGVFLYWKAVGIRTDVGEQRTLTLTDGSHVYLNTDTRVVVRYEEHVRRVELKSGEALFEVAKQPGRPFVVVAGTRDITALGTSFIVRRESEALSVTLLDGKVAVGSREVQGSVAERPSLLEPGQRLVLQPQKAPKIDQPALEKVTAWRQGQVALEDTTLAEAVHEMNRYSATKLVVERPEAGSVRVGGFFRMGDSANFARAVALTYHFQVIERAHEIVIAGSPRSAGEGAEP